jgi:adenine-specific DNA-methyltransferase
MFGNDVIDGFDIVIGNPPFVSYYARRSAKLDTATLRYYQKHYDFITETKLDGKFNTVMFFIEKACRLSNRKANVFYIMDVAFNDVPYQIYKKIFN